MKIIVHLAFLIILFLTQICYGQNQNFQHKEELNLALQTFKTAVKEKDSVSLKSLFHVGIHDEEFIDNAVQFILENKTIHSKIKRAKLKDFSTQIPPIFLQEDLEKYDDLYYWEIYTKRRKGMDSIDGFYFAYLDGAYKIVYYLQAG